MKQYCRYCAWLCIGNGIWCDEKGKELSESYTKSANTCTEYADCNIDAYSGNERKEIVRHERQKEIEGQISLFS